MTANTTSELMPLEDAHALGVDIYHSLSLVERLLEEALAAGKVPWACRRIEVKTHPKEDQASPPLAAVENRAGLFWGVPAFWRKTGVGSNPRVFLNIYWKTGFVEVIAVATDRERTLFVVRAWAILVPRAAVEALFGLESPDLDSQKAAARWIINEARKMKAAGEIPADIRITAFARALEEKMKQAARTDPSIRPVKWTYIKNNLRGWGLWPVSSIK